MAGKELSQQRVGGSGAVRGIVHRKGGKRTAVGEGDTQFYI
jgi:hypothetical protein